MSIISVHRPRVKPTRRTPRPAAPFGAGMLAYRPSAGRMPFTQQDLDWAAQAFAEDADPDYDALAGEAAFLASLEALEPPLVETCRSCGRPAETNESGWCGACDAIAAEATIANENGRHGLGFRTF